MCLFDKVFMNSFGFAARQDTPNYFVVDTDYDNFSIVYNCNNKLGFLKSGKFDHLVWMTFFRNDNVIISKYL